jgi:hydrogenase-4 component B
MPIAAAILNATVALGLISCASTLVFAKKLSHRYHSIVLLAVGLAMLSAAVIGWHTDVTWNAPAPIYLAVAPLGNRVDALSSIFIGLLAVITIAVSLFSPGYLQHLGAKVNWKGYWIQLFLFIIGMLGAILAANAISFLLFWEVFALSSTMLIVTDLSSKASRQAAFIYLGTTRIATAFLMAGFLWLYALFHTWTFSQWHFSGHSTDGAAFLILIGLCIKAGIWPFHGWLPYAHPAAPSPVSALMSGVMIKIPLYAMIRLFVLGGLGSPHLSYLMLALGLISAFWGVLCALIQHDLKTLLAYHSIENVGLILIGISLALVGLHLNLPLVATISLAGAIFHCVNHGLFKSLLFLGAGVIDSRAHTRDLELLGGLARGMPWTMLFFVIGSAAICALPPLNGFNSKWLIYQSLFKLACDSGSLWLGGLAVACIAILSLVSGMALYCFTKAVGIAFLGRARSQAAEQAKEGTPSMLVAQALLVLCCLFLGVGAPIALNAIQPVCSAAFTSPADLSTVYSIPMAFFALMMALITALIYRLWLSDRSSIRRDVTWQCGFGSVTKHMQATATSFAENIGYTFAPFLQYHVSTIIKGKDRRHFPEIVSSEVHTAKLLETRLYSPAVRLIRWLGEHVLMLQAGSIHLYLGYFLVALVTLMVIGILV